ncbi:Succinate-semialdehyde dehydrogenase [NADP(+)] GabD [Thalassoglobus neptunius]|uniref:Succinate-semialdehyde dehydrogenase [NADP(+)] GabD n=1 Tax=Thalassoglobus neptunius TaxID=1938619 RepID=A0A5C5VQ78_9PLAN|nr:aldehyde dehydrogenase family protein [Thalassoglobus neptunius]TWT39859.1 Succinate-semialdehyde dehydrogenase [NADP(+)] GabD [Thalassoglobus neptunius]
MEFYLAGQWQDRDDRIEVINPANGEVIDTVPKASADDVETALNAAVEGAREMAKLSGYRRFEILRRTADLMVENREDLARTLSQEEGKTIHEARTEVDRARQTIELSGEEAKRLTGEVLPLDGGEGVSGKLGFTLRVPCGVVAAITPFNFPLNLVSHKVGPALAGGNSIILKPASDTPLVALKFVKLLLEAGLPERGISTLTGSGSTIGSKICSDNRVRKISFTGSQEVGEKICHAAGIKKVTMELGSNSPLIVLPDADLDKVVNAVVASGYANAGQVCISAQRLIVDESMHDELMQRLIPKIESIVAGNPLQEETQMGPMVRESDAVRVESWIQEAVSQGAKLACGGERNGAFVSPALILETKPDMKIVNDELFGPGVAVSRARDIDDAIHMANDTRYGLSAGIFTQDVDSAVRFAKEVQSGNIHINWGPMWRTDLMPYGGLKDSGLGKEGPKYAIEEMTESKTVVIHS